MGGGGGGLAKSTLCGRSAKSMHGEAGTPKRPDFAYVLYDGP